MSEQKDLLESIRSDASERDVTSFTVPYYEDESEQPAAVRGTMPVYDDVARRQIVGFFFMLSGGRAKMFVAKDSRPEGGPYFSPGSEFYFTVIYDSLTCPRPYGVVSDVSPSLGYTSYKSVKFSVTG